MWSVNLTRVDGEQEEFLFVERPVVSEGNVLIRIYGEVEGELWLVAAEVREIRVRPPGTVESGI